MIYTIIATTGQWEDHQEVQVLATTSLAVVEAKFEDFKEALEALYWDMAASEHNRTVNDGAAFYNVSETVWNIGQRGWYEDTVDICIMGMVEDELNSASDLIRHATVTVTSRFENEETEIDHLYDLPPLSKYDILALPFEHLHNKRIN